MLGIVRGHNGAITVDSAVGKGSCFTVLFPASERAVKESPPLTYDAVPQGAGVILVVDDEPMVLELAKKSSNATGTQFC